MTYSSPSSYQLRVDLILVSKDSRYQHVMYWLELQGEYANSSMKESYHYTQLIIL